MRRRSILFGALLATGLGLTIGPALAQDQFITVASTTSTENSGLFGYLLPWAVLAFYLIRWREVASSN